MPVLSVPDAKGKAWRQTWCRTIPVFECPPPTPSIWTCLLTFQLILCGKYLREWQVISDQGMTFPYVRSVTQMSGWKQLTSRDCFTLCSRVASHSIVLPTRPLPSRGQAWPVTLARRLLVKLCRGANINMFSLSSLYSMWKLNSAIWWL